MKFGTNSIRYVLFFIVSLALSVRAGSDEVFIPAAIKILPALAIPPPVGPIILSALGMIQVCSSILETKKTEKVDETKAEKPLSKVDLMEARKAIINEVKTVDMHLLQESERIIRELTMVVETQGLFEEMRQTLDFFQRTFADRMKVVINPKVTGTLKRLTLDDMLNYSGEYRNKLRSFINKFIKPNVSGLLLLKPVKLFYEYILEKENYLAENDDDCTSDSLHNKIYKSFMYIIKVLTEAYALPVSAHVVRYQEALESETLTDTEELKESAISLIGEYKNDARQLIEATKWALDNAPREIRNCGKFKLQQGKTFEQISFSHTIPEIMFLEYKDVFEFRCVPGNEYVNFTEYETGECNAHTNDIPIGSTLSISVDLKKPPIDRTPFAYMKFIKPYGTETEAVGRNRSQFSLLYNVKTFPNCYTTFCTMFKKNLYAISTERVTAEPGNVITGLRFRVKNRVIYIDIQQGKFLDTLSVDPETVFWTETPESDRIAYLSSKLRKIELGDFVLKNNAILTSIQFRDISFPTKMIGILIEGRTPPDMNNTNSVAYENDDIEIDELKLVNADNPVRVGIGSKNIISKAPVAGKRYFVSFQPSDFKKDFGQTTIPLVDTREVVSSPPAPLNGIGLNHEAVDGSGGLIAFKLITPKLTGLLDALSEI